MTPYEYFANVIRNWCEKNYYTDFIVTIKINGEEITEFLEFDPASIDFIWNSDWWEGEKDVMLLGFIPIEGLVILGAPRPDMGFYIGQPDMLSEVAQQ